MFKIYRGKLLINHKDLDKLFNSALNKAPFLDDDHYCIKKFLFFYNNLNRINDPITIELIKGKVSSVHPGTFRFLAARYKKIDYLDSIFFLRDDDQSEHFVKEIAVDLKEFDDFIFFKNQSNKTKSWWELSTDRHKKTTDKNSIEYLNFNKDLNNSLESFLKKFPNHCWIYNDQIILQGDFPSVRIKVTTRKELLDSLTDLMNTHYD